MEDQKPASATPPARGWLARSLDVVERVGNRLPDPAVLFLILMVLQRKRSGLKIVTAEKFI